MSDIKINNITNRTGDTGPTIAGVSTVSTSAFMVIPSGDTAIRSAGSGRGVRTGGTDTSSAADKTMDFIQISTTGNAVDFGDLTQARYRRPGVVSNSHGGLG